MTSECLQSRCEELGVEFVFLAYSNLLTDCRSCLVPVSSLKDAQEKGCPMSPAGYFSMDASRAYFSSIPDPASFVQLPWNKKLAWVQCDVSHNGKPYEQCPRRVLQRVVLEAKKAGLTFKSGIEPEFFLTRKDGAIMADAVDANQPYPLHETCSIHRNIPLLTEIFNCMKEIGWNPYQIFHEASNCQYEINFDFQDVLTTADRLCFLKFMIKQLAEKHGVNATFMAVPFPNQTCASGMHINMSVWDGSGTTNLQAATAGDGAGIEVTPMSRLFVGGLLKYAKECTAILCANVNSYKRLIQGSWAPNTISWDINNKGVLIRIPDSARIEHRLADAATNPHLAHAILVACGTEGIKNKIEPPENSYGPAALKDRSRTLPQALNQALDVFEDSAFMKTVLGAKLVDDYVSLKRIEWLKYSKEITDWEIKFYMNC